MFSPYFSHSEFSGLSPVCFQSCPPDIFLSVSLNKISHFSSEVFSVVLPVSLQNFFFRFSSEAFPLLLSHSFLLFSFQLFPPFFPMFYKGFSFMFRIPLFSVLSSRNCPPFVPVLLFPSHFPVLSLKLFFHVIISLEYFIVSLPSIVTYLCTIFLFPFFSLHTDLP